MRVVAGKAKGREIIAPEGFDTRPITAKIKEALFSSWQPYIPEGHFLDLFAGSGSMGIEALSRGAEKVVFVEKADKAIDVIKQNLKTCKFTEGFKVYKDDVFRRVDRLKEQGEKFDIIYLDPPFTVDEIFIPVLECLADGELLVDDGLLCIRTLTEKEMPDTCGKLEKIKLKTYGISTIHYYQIAE